MEPRTAKVLVSLLAAMTLGALLLMLMETQPPRPAGEDFASIRETVTPANWNITHNWRRIVVHSSTGGPQDALPRHCHFIIRSQPRNGKWIEATSLWRDQEPGFHTYVTGRDYNADSIGICLMGDYSEQSPDENQFQALISLVRYLQQQCNIDADSVYLRSQLPGEVDLPGRAFPVGRFNSSLFRTTPH